MKEYYEKFDHSKLSKFKDFLKYNFELEEYDREVKNKAGKLLDELMELHKEALDECTKETDEIIKKLNDPLIDESTKENIRFNIYLGLIDIDYNFHSDPEVYDTIIKLFYIASNRKTKIK